MNKDQRNLIHLQLSWQKLIESRIPCAGPKLAMHEACSLDGILLISLSRQANATSFCRHPVSRHGLAATVYARTTVYNPHIIYDSCGRIECLSAFIHARTSNRGHGSTHFRVFGLLSISPSRRTSPKTKCFWGWHANSDTEL